MSRFKYRERSPETVQARANQSTGDFDSYINGPLLKLKEGESTLRILPPTWDFKKWGDNWAIECFIHRDIGPDKSTYLCLSKMGEGDCPLCEARREFEDDEELAKALRPQKQVLCYVIDRADEKAGPQVWRLPISVEKEIQLRSQDKKTREVLAIDHPDNGFDIFVTKTGTGLKTKYSGVDIDRDESPLSDKDSRQEAWLQYIEDHPLPDMLVYFDADYLEKQFRGKAKSEREEPARARRGRDADEPPVEERPARASRSRRPEPEPEEAEEEAPPPRSNRRRSTRIEEEDAAPPSRAERARAQRQALEEDEIPSDGKGRARASKDAEEEEDDRNEKPVARARRALERLKPSEDD